MIRAACLILLAAGAGWAQTASAPLEFEVASVKPSGRDQFRDILGVVIPLGMRGGPGTGNPGQISFTNASLKTVGAYAYSVERYQVSGPDWIETVGFDIVAKVPPDASKEQVRAMLQSLLEERFKLTLHREKRELPVYTLVVAKSGLKMTVSHGDPEAGGSWGAPNGAARWVSPHTTMKNLADFLSSRLDRPVIDNTGLTGKYDFTLTWEAENLDPKFRAFRAANAPAEAEPAEPVPTIFGALQQLGLKLEQSKSAIDVLVIDHAEKTPTEN